MKITYLHQYFNTPSMPGSTRSYEIARRLVAKGHQVNIVTTWRDNDERKHWFKTCENGINVYWLPVPYSNRMSFGHRIYAFLKFAILGAFRASSFKADIVFATSTPLTIAIPAVYASKRNNIPFVFEIRDLWPEMPIAIGALKNPFFIRLSRALEWWSYKNANATIALSPGMKEGILRRGYPKSHIAVIPNSCDNNEFSPTCPPSCEFCDQRPWLADGPLLIYAGTFGLVNGVGYLVSLAKELKSLDSNVRILLVGDGAERDIIYKHAYSSGILNVNFFMENSIPKNQIAALFSASTMTSSLFVDIPEMRVNSANKFFDSLAAGRPVLINYGGWMNDLILKYKCGIAAWGLSSFHVAQLLNSKMNDPEWLLCAGHSARKLAERYFDRDILVSQLEQVLIASAEGKSYLAQSIAPGTY